MRILMLDNEFPPLGGGMGTANEAVLRYFARHTDLEVDLITAEPGGRLQMESFSDTITISKVPVWNRNIHHSTNHELLTYTALSLPLALQYQRRRSYDLCFAWSTVPAGWVAYQVYQRTGLPYMVWVSGPDIPGFELRYRHVYPFIWPFLRSTWQHAAAVVVKCEGEAQMIAQLDSQIDLLQIPNGVDVDAFQPGPPIPDDGPLQLICVGRLIERKGQHHLIEAVKRLADEGVDVVLSLVGTGDSQEDYQHLARRLGVSEQVRFVGYIPREEIPAHYAAAHVFVSPSYNEGMSIAVLEGLAAGLPVVATITGGTEELITPNVNGLVFDWADIDTLAAHLRMLATDRALARRMSIAARERALLFSWDAISRSYLELFDQLLAQGKTG